MDPILSEISWSLNRWEREAGVGHGVAAHYMSGESDLEDESRGALEGAIRCELERIGSELQFDGLPD